MTLDRINISSITRSLILISIILFISRMAFPGLKYPFIIVYILSIISCVPLVNRSNLLKSLKLLVAIWQFLLVGFLLILGMLLTRKIRIEPFSEIVSYVVIVTFFVQIVIAGGEYSKFLNSLLEYLVCSSVLIAFLGLLKFIVTFENNPYEGTSFVNDYNFYVLYSVLGIIVMLARPKIVLKRFNKLWLNLFLLILFVNIVFSYSRRGLIVVGILLLYIVTNNTFAIVKKRANVNPQNYLFFFSTAITIIFLFSMFVFTTNGKTKKSLSERIGINYSSVKLYTSTLIYRYMTIINPDINYYDIVKKYYNLKFDSKDPDTWNLYNIKVVDNVYNKGLKSVPFHTKGILLDSTLEASKYYEVARKYIKILTDTISDWNSLQAFVYCYVSTDFSGTKVRLLIKGSVNKQALYDMTKKGEWQKLSINSVSKAGKEELYFAIFNEHSNSFSTMKGYVIFAYPKMTEVPFNKYDPGTWGRDDNNIVYPLNYIDTNLIPLTARGLRLDSTSSGNSKNNLTRTYTQIFCDTINRNEILELTVFCYVSKDFDGDQARLFCKGAAYSSSLYDMSQKGNWQKLTIRVKSNGGPIIGYLYMSRKDANSFKGMNGYVLYAYPNYNIFIDGQTIEQTNQSGVSKFSFFSLNEIKLNLIESKYNMHISLDTLSDEKNVGEIEMLLNNKLAGQRLARWRYAFDLFKNYTVRKKVFGGGFTYLELFGEKFYGNKERLDYPHNPIISALLYSGLVGTLFYIIFLFFSILYYWQYRSYHEIFFIMYLVTFFFVFFSSDSHFDTPIFAFLSLLPFITRYFVNKDFDNNR